MQSIMQMINFTQEERDFFLSLYQSLPMQTKKTLEDLKWKTLTPSPDFLEKGFQINDRLTAIAHRLGIHLYSLHMLFLLLCVPELPRLYRQKGIDEKYAYNILPDICCKLKECEKVEHVMGERELEWFYHYFTLTRFAVGYFQYDSCQWDLDVDYHFGDIHLTKGDPIYKIHIPSSGKMTRQARLASYCEAHDFFGYKKGEPIALFCRSWLLYEKYRDVYPVGSNLVDFMDDLDLFWNKDLDTFDDAWRIFYQPYNGDPSVLPQDTRLQRNFVDYINKGGEFGIGAGVIICDGERILNNKRDN